MANVLNNLTAEQCNSLHTYLSSAAERYDDFRKECALLLSPLADQFQIQATEARKLADLFFDADSAVLSIPEDDNARRQRIEHEIVTTAVESLLAADYMISVNDGEDNVLLNSQDQTAILDAMFSTDEDILFVRKREINSSTKMTDIRDASAMIHLVYGNDGHDVIADNSVSIEPLLAAATALAEKYANED